jgi:hypothetical protein
VISAFFTALSDLEVKSSGGSGVSIGGFGSLERSVVRSDAPSGIFYACNATNGTVVRDTACKSTGDFGIAMGNNASCSGTPGTRATVKLVNVTADSTGANSLGLIASASEGCSIATQGVNVNAGGTEVDVYSSTDSEPSTAAAIDLDYSRFATVGTDGTGATATAAGTADNITAAAIFADAVHQDPASPTRNAGTAAPALGSIVPGDLGTLDIDREERVLESAPDIGADEYGPAPNAAITKPTRTTFKTSKGKKKVKFKFTAAGAGSFECKIDKKPWKACASGDNFKLKSKPGKGKKHTVRVRALNPIGEIGAKDVWKGRVKRRS